MLKFRHCWLCLPVVAVLVFLYGWAEIDFEIRLRMIDRTEFVKHFYGEDILSPRSFVKILEIPPALDKEIQRIGEQILENPGTKKTTVLVTACDTSHFREVKDAIASVQTNYPNHAIILYDLGLSASEIKEVTSWCNVEYRKFDFDKYPLHIRQHLYSCSWKPVVIKEALQTYQSVVWFDASIRVICRNFSSQLASQLENYGVSLMIPTGHSIYAATDPRLYQSFPANESRLTDLQMYGATIIGIKNTHDVFHGIIKWWVRCALDRDCADPRFSTNMCSFKPNRYKFYANCHRYDQSAINILLVNKLKQKFQQCIMPDNCVRAMRQPTSMFNISICV